jgi:hypothetical protein
MDYSTHRQAKKRTAARPTELIRYDPKYREWYEAAQKEGRVSVEFTTLSNMKSARMTLYRYRKSLDMYHGPEDAEFNAFVQRTEIGCSEKNLLLEIRKQGFAPAVQDIKSEFRKRLERGYVSPGDLLYAQEDFIRLLKEQGLEAAERLEREGREKLRKELEEKANEKAGKS